MKIEVNHLEQPTANSQQPTQTNNAADRIRKLAEHYDQNGKRQQRILVRNSLKYLRRLGIRERVKGGPLMIGEHVIEQA